MTGIFSITTTSTAVRLDAQRGGDLVFMVTNQAGCALRARFTPRPRDGHSTSWLRVDGDSERQLDEAAVERVRLRIAVPDQVSAGVYAFRLEVVGVANPDEHVGEGPWVEVTVPAVAAPRAAFPWWVLPFIASGLALCGGGILLNQDDHVATLILVSCAILLAIGGIVLMAYGRSPHRAPEARVPAPVPAPVPRIPSPASPIVSVDTVAVQHSDVAVPMVTATVAPVIAPLHVRADATVSSDRAPQAAPHGLHTVLPRLVGWMESDARTALSALGVTVGTVTTVVSVAAPGTVLDQRPADGQPIVAGQTVTLEVAGPAPSASDGHAEHLMTAVPGALT